GGPDRRRQPPAAERRDPAARSTRPAGSGSERCSGRQRSTRRGAALRAPGSRAAGCGATAAAADPAGLRAAITASPLSPSSRKESPRRAGNEEKASGARGPHTPLLQPMRTLFFSGLVALCGLSLLPPAQA
ncbi:MAG: hypothetical protein ACK55I_24370, partial [bacterium]